MGEQLKESIEYRNGTRLVYALSRSLVGTII